ncbi:MAG TPA: glycosyltransferase family 39 protein, partial [Thermoanaerobaculia bacterium]|nr:glycosyltransferase family 39 protein [Thermoanaerobaculia bacterium]
MGHVSNDGLGHSFAFAEGSWRINPNHLLFEPLGAWWQGLWTRIDPDRAPVDALKLLSGLSGALAAGLFRWGVAGRLAESRWAANHATAWLAFSSAFLRLWISDEIHMIQMPFVVAAAVMALRYLERPALSRALATGAAVGLAGLGFISNLLLGPALALGLAWWHLRRRDARSAVTAIAGIGVGSAVVAGSAFLAVWASSPAPVGFVDWLTRYGGGAPGERV